MRNPNARQARWVVILMFGEDTRTVGRFMDHPWIDSTGLALGKTLTYSVMNALFYEKKVRLLEQGRGRG